jgi:3'(2'), 5'-bisphosphate nucleotidase
MTPSPADAQRIEKILRECGAMLLDCLAAGITEGQWSGAQFKAKADDLAHDFLITALSSAYPGVHVVSEEDATSIAACAADYFIIDPIDGTASFANGFAGWVTQAAYISEGRTLMAGIYAPSSDEYFSAIRKQGAYCNGRYLSVAGASNRAMSLIDNYPEPRGIAQSLKQALHIHEYVESGSISLKICRVAERSADLFVKDMSPRDWDVAAPMLLLAEAGGTLTDINGDAILLGGPERRHQGLIAAASPVVAKQVRDWLASRK